MHNTTDIYLGTFLILCGFALSMFNLRKVVKNTKFSAVLLSENVLLVCIGVAFVGRAISQVNPLNSDGNNIMERHSEASMIVNCSFQSVLIGYGPLVVSMVNSFLSLIIDNYIHYSIIKESKEKVDENTVSDVTYDASSTKIGLWKDFYKFVKRYFSYIAIATQWVVPLVLALLMYPMGVKEKLMSMHGMRNIDKTCMSIMNVQEMNCSIQLGWNVTTELRVNDLNPVQYIEVEQKEPLSNISNEELAAVINKVRNIVTNYKYDRNNYTVTLPSPFRRSKRDSKCKNICYLENKNILVYMFLLAVVSYFTPITISTIILTKIHVMNIKKPVVKEYVSREVLYNVLFWTPIMFDTFLSLLLCSYEANGTRTSILNVIANVYQVVKNFMNTKYFSNNAVLPV